MARIIDSVGSYEPIVNCNCIDQRTMYHIDNILRITYEKLDKDMNDASKPEGLRQAAQRDIAIVNELKDIFKNIDKCP